MDHPTFRFLISLTDPVERLAPLSAAADTVAGVHHPPSLLDGIGLGGELVAALRTQGRSALSSRPSRPNN